MPLGGPFPRDSSAVNGLGGACTNVPSPCRVTTRPWLVSSARASRTVLRDASNCRTRSGSLGSRSSGASAPLVIWLAEPIGDLLVLRVRHAGYSLLAALPGPVPGDR